MQYPQTRYQDSLSVGITDTALSLTVVSVPPTRTQGILTLGRLTSNTEDVFFTSVAGNVVTLSLRGLSQTALTPTEVAGNRKTHSANESVEITTHHNYDTDLLRKTEDDTVSGTITFTLPSRVTGLNDSNGNEVVETPATGSAINQIRIANASIGTNPIISARGDDVDIGIEIQGKGTGVVILPDGSELKTSAAPVTDADIANKKYVDDTVGGGTANQRLTDSTVRTWLETVVAGNAVSFEPPLNNTAGALDANYGRATAGAGVRQAWSFRPGSVPSAFALNIFMRKVGSPADNITVRIETDNAGEPSGTLVTNGAANALVGNSLTTSYASVAFGWPSVPVLAVGTLYWVVLQRDGATSDTDYYQVRYQSAFRSYRAGTAMKKFTTVWTTNTGVEDMLDFDFGTSFSGGIVKSVNSSSNSSRLMKNWLGVMDESAAIGDTGKRIIQEGIITGLSGLTASSDYYISTTPGALTTVVSDDGRVVARTKELTTQLYLGVFANGQINLGASDGLDGALNVTAGTTILNLGQVYNFTTINVSGGATLAFTGTGGAFLNATGAITIAGTIELRNSVATVFGVATNKGYFLQSGSVTPVVTLSVGGTGGTGGGGGAGAGGDGGTSTVAGAGTGGAGGAALNPGNPGAGGGSLTGGGGGGGGGSGSATSGTNGSNAAALVGGAGGGGAGETVVNEGTGGGGAGGGGFNTGNGGAGAQAGTHTTVTPGTVTCGNGGAGGSSGANGGTGGVGGVGGATGSIITSGSVTGGIGGAGGSGFTGGGTGGNAGAVGSVNGGAFLGQAGGAGGNSDHGTGGSGGTGGGGSVTSGSINGGVGGAGGKGRTGGGGGTGGAGSVPGVGGVGGDGSSGSTSLFIAGSSTLSFTGTVNAQGGDGGAGGTGGAATSTNVNGATGGNGGNGGDGADVIMVCMGVLTNSGTVNNTRGLGGNPGGGGARNGTGVNGISGLRGRDGRDGVKVISQLISM